MEIKIKEIENLLYISKRIQKYYVQICKLVKESNILNWHYVCVRNAIVAWISIKKKVEIYDSWKCEIKFGTNSPLYETYIPETEFKFESK